MRLNQSENTNSCILTLWTEFDRLLNETSLQKTSCFRFPEKYSTFVLVLLNKTVILDFPFYTCTCHELMRQHKRGNKTNVTSFAFGSIFLCEISSLLKVAEISDNQVLVVLSLGAVEQRVTTRNFVAANVLPFTSRMIYYMNLNIAWENRFVSFILFLIYLLKNDLNVGQNIWILNG